MTIANEEQFKMNETNRSSEFVEKFPTGKVCFSVSNSKYYFFFVRRYQRMKTMLAFIFSKQMLLLISVNRRKTEHFRHHFIIDLFLVSNDQLRGQTPVEQSQVFQWIEYSDREISPVSQTLVYPCMGILQFNKNQNEHAKSELKKILNLLDQYLSTRTYLVGERVTLADVTVACDLFLLFQWVERK